MFRKLVLLIIISCLTVTNLVSRNTQFLSNTQVSVSQSEGVHNLNSSINYATIQEAIDAPETLDGHTIFVDAGTYYGEVVVNKRISLIGENKSTTVIDGDGSLIVLAIKSDWVFVSGFTVQNSYGEPGSGGGGLVVKGAGNVQISDITACDNDADWGIHLNPNSHNVNITGTVIANNSRGGLLLNEAHRANLTNSTIVNNEKGIEVRNADNNIISENIIANNTGNGVFIDHCNNNFVLNNTIFGNVLGLCPQSSTNITLSFNQMTNNTYDFSVYANSLSEFMHDIDSSNTVNGKPIYYWVDKENQEVPGDAGYVAVINSRNITVQDLNLTRNGGGVSLAFTTNSTVKNVTAEHNWGGIGLLASYNNTLTDNVASNNLQAGIALTDSGDNTLRNNTMTNNPVNFWVTSGPMPTPQVFINDVDLSNTVDGKPIYYWVNQSDRVVPSDAGCVIVANSTNITVKDSNLTKNGFGVGLACSTNCTIKNVTARYNLIGIALAWCVDTWVEENTVADNAQCGFIVIFSLNSSLNKNWLSGNGYEMGMPGGGPGGGLSVLYSNATTISNNTIIDNPMGVALGYSFDNTVIRNNITNNGDSVILQYSNDNELTENNVTHNNEGFRLEASSGNEITSNRVTNNTNGIRLQESYSNIFILNNITSNTDKGLDLSFSGNNTLRENRLTDNQWNFGIWGDALSDFINDVDISNTVNDNSIVYLVNQTNLTVNPSTFPQVGCLVVVNSTNINVQSLTLENNYETITLAYTSDSTIANITATNNFVSMLFWNANNNTITNSVLADNMLGPTIGSSNDNRLINNEITNNFYQSIGLFSDSHNNTLIGNVVKNSSCGVFLRMSEENTFSHNNFVNNTNQVYIEESPNNVWDDGVEGNYWSDYYGCDSDDDGIGESWYEMGENNTDHFPLMGTFSDFNTSLGYPVDVISNSTIEDFEHFDFNSTIKLHVSNMTTNQTHGFCRITIPHDIMSPPYNVTINDNPVTHTTVYENETLGLSIIYFSYEHSTLEITIIPEFQSVIVMPLFMIATLAAVIVYKRKHSI